MPSPTVVEFVSASTAAPVFVELGFIPAAVQIISDHTGVPIVWEWLNNAQYSGFPIANTVTLPGAAVAFSANTATLIAPYAGGDTITSAETANTSGKHVNRAGAPSTAGRVTAPGISIAAGAQVNSGRNIVKAYRSEL